MLGTRELELPLSASGGWWPGRKRLSLKPDHAGSPVSDVQPSRSMTRTQENCYQPLSQLQLFCSLWSFVQSFCPSHTHVSLWKFLQSPLCPPPWLQREGQAHTSLLPELSPGHLVTQTLQSHQLPLVSVQTEQEARESICQCVSVCLCGCEMCVHF